MASNNAKAPVPANGVITAPAKGVVGGNRKKQKRRAKQALKAAAQQQAHPAGHHPSELDYHEDPLGYDDEEEYEYSDGDIEQYNDQQYSPQHATSNGYEPPPPTMRGNKGKNKRQAGHMHGGHLSPMSSHLPPLPHLTPPAGMSSAALRTVQKSVSMDRNIWNTSTQQERQNIKDFWLSLSEEERKSLLKIEKEAVLKKMKQQQKHSCSCTVCGRKRTAIEEELEVLYEGYYEELEQYAHHDNPPLPSADGTVPAPLDYQRPPHPLSVTRPNIHHPPHRTSRVQELLDEDENPEEEPSDDDEEYSDEEEYSDDEDLMPPPQRNLGVPDFFNFGENLTVKDNLLTVADDLLKNDGRKFIEMMEQLAERRMQRENDAIVSAEHPTHPGAYPPNGPSYNQEDPLAAGDEFDDDEASYDSQEEYDDDLEEEDEMVRKRNHHKRSRRTANRRHHVSKGGLTEEQRMQEGKRMFQIFAARMFEQRVLTAYREKVAAERQQKLLEELEDEGRLEAEREAKKARDAEKRKNKKKQQQQAKAEEKARKEAEKAAEEARLREAEEKKQEEQRRKKEEQRKKKEEERRKQEEERTRKEAEKQRRQLEEHQKREEVERKAREARAAEKARKEEARKREREEKEARDREAKDRKAQEEKDKKEKEAKAKADKEAKDREKTAQQAAQPPQMPHPPAIQKRPSQAAIAVPNAFQKQTPSGVSSPHPAIATPALPKAPTPNMNKPRQPSLQGSHASSPKQAQSQVSSAPSKASSPGNAPAQQQPQIQPKQILQKPGPHQQGSQFQHPMQTTSPLNQPPTQPPPGMGPPQQHPGGFGGMPPAGFQGFPGPQTGMMHGGMGQRGPMPMFAHQGPPQGMPPNRMGMPGMSGYNGMPPPPPGMMPPHGRGMPHGFEGPGAGAPPGFGPPHMSNHTSPVGQPPGPPVNEPTRQQRASIHSRQQSASGKEQFEGQVNQPIARPAPIQRPSSVKPPGGTSNTDIDDLSQHLGSSALIDGSDEPEPSIEARRQSAIPISNRNGPIGGGMGPIGSFGSPSNGFGAPVSSSWNAPSMVGFNPNPAFGQPHTGGWGLPPMGVAWNNHSNSNAFSSNGFASLGQPHHPQVPRVGVFNRPLVIRLAVCHACKQLGDAAFHNVDTLLSQIERNAPPLDSPPSLREIEEICETEGDSQNGGGELHVSRELGPKGFAVKWEPGAGSAPDTGRGALGEIGSPMARKSIPASGFGAPGMGRSGFGSLGAVGSSQGQ